MYVSYNELASSKDATELTFLEKLTCIFTIVLFIALIICGFLATKDYDVEVQASLINNEFVTHEREPIGYASTFKQTNVVVYDSPYVRDYYNATYSYMVNGREYSFILKTYHKPKENMSIWVNSESPNNFVLDGVKCNPADLLPILN